MITMMVFETDEKERKFLCACCKDLAGKLSEDYWDIHPCSDNAELEKYIDESVIMDMACLDVTVSNAILLAEKLRKKNPQVYITLIADETISPVTYMKPTIMAASLLLKPFHTGEVLSTLEAVIQTYLKDVEQPDTDKVFVLENKDGRWRIDHNRILYFEARDKKIFLNVDNEEFVFYDTIKHIEDSVPEQFIRCHRSFLVNKNRVRRFYSAAGVLVLEGNIEIPVSRTYKQEMRRFFK